MQEGKNQLAPDGEQNQELITDIETYYSLFQEVSDEVAIGEASTQYLYSPEASVCIKKYLPDVKLIAILRNPVDRAYSGFLHNMGQIPDPLNSFVKSLQSRKSANEDIVGNSIQMGFYFTQLKRYFDLFEKKQIKVYLYENFKQDPMSMLQDILKFLEVDETFVPDISSKQHITEVYKNKALYSLSKFSLLKSSLKQIIPRQLFELLKNQNLEKPQELTIEIRRQLLEEFRSEIIRLQNLIHEDLSIWLELENNFNMTEYD